MGRNRRSAGKVQTASLILSCALMLAYYAAQNDYEMIRELPTGKGFADLAFVPRRYSDKPAMLIELKYDKSVDTAMNQIKEKRYGGVLKGISDQVLLIGINYDKNSKEYDCMIETVKN